MKKINNLKKKIIYRSEYRGTKEMDLLLGKFVKKYINIFKEYELNYLVELLNLDDEIIYKWYLKKDLDSTIPINSVTKKLKINTLIDKMIDKIEKNLNKYSVSVPYHSYEIINYIHNNLVVINEKPEDGFVEIIFKSTKNQ